MNVANQYPINGARCAEILFANDGWPDQNQTQPPTGMAQLRAQHQESVPKIDGNGLFLGRQHAGNATDDILCIFENTRVGKTRNVRVDATQFRPMYKKQTTKQNATDAFDSQTELNTNYLSVQLEVGMNQHPP